MKEWNVYVNGRYIGCVDARDEDDARCAAFTKYSIGSNDSLSVSRR